jgi:predicted RND superfamily exporter protein
VISPRESISAAVFKLLQAIQTSPAIATFSRRYIDSTALGTANLPAVELLVKSEDAIRKGMGIPIEWKVTAHVFVFVSTTDTDTEPDTVMNNILDAIEAAVAPDRTGYQTLGGLVVNCRINGTIERDPGFMSGVGAAAIPIEITTTS